MESINKGSLRNANSLVGKLNNPVIREFPELEDLNVVPKKEAQTFKSEMYGYNIVSVAEIPSEEIFIEPSKEEQVIEGLYDKITVNPITADQLSVRPTEQTQSFSGLYDEVNVQPILTEEVAPEIDFSTNDSIKVLPQEGYYLKGVTLNKDENLTPDDIKLGVTIFGVQGNLSDTSDATATRSDIVAGKSAYVDNQKVIGSMPNNQELVYTPSDNEQIIPEGYTSGGKVSATDITTLNDYQVCEDIADNILEGTEPTELMEINNCAYLNYNGGRTNCLYELLKFCKNVTDCSAMFRFCTNLTELDLSSFDTSKVKNMFAMFDGCNIITELNLSNFNTENVTYMPSMFSSCSQLTTLDISSFNTNKVTSMSSMFDGCRNLQSLDLSNFNTENVTNMYSMFSSCSQLTTLDISSFNTNKVTNTGTMFSQCTSLNKLIINSPNVFKITTNATNVFNGTPILNGTGYIYVPDDLVSTYKVAQYWSGIASQIKPISELEGGTV